MSLSPVIDAMPYTQRTNALIIADVVAWMTSGRGDPRGLIQFAVRESGLKHRSDAGSEKDSSGAKKAWLSGRAEFFAKAGNPWVEQPELWWTSRGLFQSMPPYYLQRWDPRADPRVLWHPVVATVVAIRTWNTWGAKNNPPKNLAALRTAWASGSVKNSGPFYDERLASLTARAQRLGWPEIARMSFSDFGMESAGRSDGPQPGDLPMLIEISRRHGISTDPANVPSTWVPGSSIPDDDDDDHEQKTQTGIGIRALGLGIIAAGALGVYVGLRK